VTALQPSRAAAPPTLTPDEFAARLAALRDAFARCHAALTDAADKMAMATGLGMTAPSRTIIQSYASATRAAADALAAEAAAQGWRA
jgi:hypothetical protein